MERARSRNVGTAPAGHDRQDSRTAAPRPDRTAPGDHRAKATRTPSRLPLDLPPLREADTRFPQGVGSGVRGRRGRWQTLSRPAPDGVRNLMRAGVTRSIAKRISGHKTDSVFERYDIDTDDDLREAVERVAAYVDALPSVPTVVAFSGQQGGEKQVQTRTKGGQSRGRRPSGRPSSAEKLKQIRRAPVAQLDRAADFESVLAV